uniref:(northern house mosquito) hypothetical protein n=1 Tax=Culex pipiens TaxID=7175 RepID=A0A8D8KWQ5_CULPI
MSSDVRQILPVATASGEPRKGRMPHLPPGAGQQDHAKLSHDERPQRHRSADDLRDVRAGIPQQNHLGAAREGARRNRGDQAGAVPDLPKVASRRDSPEPTHRLCARRSGPDARVV